MVVVPEGKQDLSGGDFDGDGDGLGVEVVPADGETESGVDPTSGEMGESTRNGRKAGHLSDRAEG